MFWRCIFVRSPLTLEVNLHNFTPYTAFHRKIMYKICGEKTNFSPLILHVFQVFLDPGSFVYAPNSNLYSSWSIARPKPQKFNMYYEKKPCSTLIFNEKFVALDIDLLLKTGSIKRLHVNFKKVLVNS